MYNKIISQRVIAWIGRILSTVVLSMSALVAVQAADYYVSTSGSDNNNGSAGSPWRTVGKAVSSVAANAGHTIRMGAGTFYEVDYLRLPSGVSLVGAGINQTIIQVAKYYDLTSELITRYGGDAPDPNYQVYYSRPEKFAIQLLPGGGTSANPQVLSDFTLRGWDANGVRKRGHGGIFSSDIRYLTINAVQVIDFKFTGIWLPKAQNLEISNCVLANNAFGNKSRSFADFLYRELSDARIHDNTITETSANGVGQYGMTYLGIVTDQYDIPLTNKYEEDSRTTYEPANRPNSEFTSVNVKIYRNIISVPDFGTWDPGGGETAAFTIEGFGSRIGNWEIYDNTLNNGISPISNGGTGGSIGPIRIHHNRFNLTSYEYKAAVEANVPYLEFDHNYIDGGFPLRQYEDRSNEPGWTDYRIHHNVFNAPTASYPFNSGPTSIAQFERFPSNFKFYNNTIYDTKGLTQLFNTGRPGATGAEIRNNIFLSVADNTVRNLTGTDRFDNPAVDHNLFLRYTPFGSDVVNVPASTVASAILKGTGSKPRPFFELASNSPAINAGVPISGITDDAVGAPDLGAYESGSTTPPPGASIENNAIYKIESALTGRRVLDVDNSGEANGTPIQLWESNDSPAQRWRAVDVGSGYHKLVPQHTTGLALDIDNSGTANGSKVQLWEDNDSPAQQFKLTETGDGYFTIQPRYTTTSVLDVSGSTDANGTAIQLWEINNSAAQKWRFIRQSSGGRLASTESGTETIFTVSPNPVEGQAIHVQFSGVDQPAFQLRDLSGKAITTKQTNLEPGILMLTPQSEQPTGIYLLTLPTSTRPITKRILLK